MGAPRLDRVDFDPERLQSRRTVRFAGRLDAISPAVEQLMGEVRTMECSKGKEFEIETALREAIANAVRHGCGNDGAKEVEAWVGCDESRGMLIVVRDPGPGFDPANIPSPIVGQNVFRSHGRGIYLINELMDEVSFESGGTEIRMLKRR
jgi:serine/threonine-protein kinase RsbW